MNRLEKKCFLASMAAHGLLVLVLLLAPAFLVPDKKLPDESLLDLIPIPQNILDEFRPSGTPGVKPQDMRMAPQPTVANPAPPTPPPAQQQKAAPPEPPPAPEPPPQAKKVVSPVPKIEEEPKKTAKTKTEPVKETSKSKVKVDLASSKSIVLGKSKAKSDSKSKTNDDDAKRKEQEREAKRIAGIANAQAERIADALNGLRKNLTGGTQIYVPGDGDGIYATYSQYVKSVYDRAWVFTDDIADLRMAVQATITIARDGTVISARIKRKSGTSVLDRSVQDVLLRVKYIAPFPEGSKEVERTFELNFNPATKRATG